MKRLAVAFALSLLALHAADEKSAPAITLRPTPSPAGDHALGASLVTAGDRSVWLTWVETPGAPATSAHHHDHAHAAAASPASTAAMPANTLYVSRYDAKRKTWGARSEIAHGSFIAPSSADFPQLAVDGHGHPVAVWVDGHGGAFWSSSTDKGETWTAPQAFAPDGHEVEKFSLVTLADGRVLAAWLDGRAKQNVPPGQGVERLYARVLDEPGTAEQLVDASVCDCCQTTLTAFPDGGALVAYRGRTTDEVRDIRVARLRHGAWGEPHVLNHDGWHIAACPINGPQLASDGGRVAVAWFTAAGKEPRVLASFSADAGTRFLMPLRLDRGQPTGHVDTFLLHDGAMLVIWTESDGSAWLRRISPEFTADDAPVALAAAGELAGNTVPRATLVRNYHGGHGTAELMVAFAVKAGGLRILRARVPEGELLDAEKKCQCAPTAGQLRGFPIRGAILEAATDSASVRVRHQELPGIFDAGDRTFRISPDVLAALKPGRRFLGRVEQRGGDWWLFDVRLVAEAPARE